MVYCIRIANFVFVFPPCHLTIILHTTQPQHNHTTQPNKRGSKRGKAGRPEATQQPATLKGRNERQMREKRQQLDERQGCRLTKVVLQQERQWLDERRWLDERWRRRMQQPAKQERLKERQSRQTGGYAKTSHIRGAQQ